MFFWTFKSLYEFYKCSSFCVVLIPPPPLFVLHNKYICYNHSFIYIYICSHFSGHLIASLSFMNALHFVVFLLPPPLICAPECGRTHQENSGTLRSPEYPNASPPPEGEKCEWRITATHGEKIVLNITALDVYKTDGCRTDYLEIRDGVWHKDPLLGNICI